MAADMYLVDNLANNLLERIKNELNESNCCLIYDQLIKLQKEESTLNYVRNLIELNSEAAFKNNYFSQIDQTTLIDILKMKSLNINEIDVLIACSKWVDAEIERQMIEPIIENKRKMFVPLKCLINFTEMNADQVGKIGEILRVLLNNDEIASLFLHLFDKTQPLTIKNETIRTKPKLYSVSAKPVSFYFNNVHSKRLNFQDYLAVNQSVLIASIKTLLGDSVNNLDLKIAKNEELLDLKHEKVSIDGKWSFKFDKLKDFLKLDAGNEYKLHFTFINTDIYKANLSSDFTFKLQEDNKSIEFEIKPNSLGFHCISEIEFYTTSYAI